MNTLRVAPGQVTFCNTLFRAIEAPPVISMLSLQLGLILTMTTQLGDAPVNRRSLTTERWQSVSRAVPHRDHNIAPREQTQKIDSSCMQTLESQAGQVNDSDGLQSVPFLWRQTHPEVDHDRSQSQRKRRSKL